MIQHIDFFGWLSHRNIYTVILYTSAQIEMNEIFDFSVTSIDLMHVFFRLTVVAEFHRLFVVADLLPVYLCAYAW